MAKIDELVKQLTPYQEREFITIPLMEEGVYAPTINFWQKWGWDEQSKFCRELKINFKREKISAIISVDNNRDIYTYSVSPKVKKDYSISPKWELEKVLEIILNTIKQTDTTN